MPARAAAARDSTPTMLTPALAAPPWKPASAESSTPRNAVAPMCTVDHAVRCCADGQRVLQQPIQIEPYRRECVHLLGPKAIIHLHRNASLRPEHRVLVQRPG